MSLLAQLKAGKRNIKALDYPGIEGQKIALRVLNNQDIQDAVFAAEDIFKAKGFDEIPRTLQDAYQDERSTQILFRAMREPDAPDKPFAATANETRLLEKEEKDFFLQEYTDFEQACSPQISKMTDKEFEELWAAVKKSPMLSSALNSSTLIGLITYLASRPANSQTDSGSTS